MDDGAGAKIILAALTIKRITKQRCLGILFIAKKDRLAYPLLQW